MRRVTANSREAGFTLIELMVVMLIIGVLVAIAIPVFLSQRQKAEDSAAKADVATLGAEMATYWVDGTAMPTVVQTGDQYFVNGVFVGNSSNNVVLQKPLKGSTRDDWCVWVTNPQGKEAKTGFKYSSVGGLQPGSC